MGSKRKIKGETISMDKPILHLNLKKKWFDMILSGEKKEEYREISAYWTRVFSSHVRIKGMNYHPSDVIICFSNGYSKDRRQFKIECNGLRVGRGRYSWGGSEDKQFFILSLGNIVDK